MAEYLQVKNWENFQHYKDRSPPWIKLHRDLLRDYDFSCLQDASKLHLMLLWLLSSQLDNKIPNDPAWITRQLGLSEPVNLKPLIEQGFIILVQDASKSLAERKQSAIVETETETYKSIGSSAKPTNPIADQFEVIWKEYPKRAGSNPKNKAFSAYQARIKSGVDANEIQRGLGRYISFCESTNKINTETVMQAQRFFGPGCEWENDWSCPDTRIKLPFDNHELWQIRAKLGLEPTYDAVEPCHAEIRAALAKQPNKRQELGL